METIKYAKNNLDFTKELRTRVKEYFLSNNLQQDGSYRIIIKSILMIAVYLVPYALLISGTVTSVLLALLLFFIMGLGMSGLGMATMHDANHGSFSRNKKVNNFFSKSLYLLGGFPPNWRFQHNTLHHGYTNIEGHDEDIAPPDVLRFSPHQPLKKMHRYQYLYAWFLYGLMTLLWATVKDFRRLNKYKKMGATLSTNRSFRSLYTELILAKIMYYALFFIIPLLLVQVAWYWIIVGFILMHFTSGLVLSTIFQTAHVVPTSNYPLPSENNVMNNNWVVHQLYTTSDYSPRSTVFSWLIGGLNYQVVHHLFPNISHVHYKNLAPIVQETAAKYDLPYYVNRNFMVAIQEHIKMLKQLGGKIVKRKIKLNPIPFNEKMAVNEYS